MNSNLNKTTTPNSVIDKIFNLYNKYGSRDYIGEGLTQTEHALQCAECAEKDIRLDNYDDYIKNCVIVAALLHDIGHLIGMENGDMQMKDAAIFNGASLGIVGHEGIGRAFLKSCGMPYLVYELVGSHVQAKRYLCTINKKYYDKLSDASKETMKMQGGLMTPAEIMDFKLSVMPELKVYLREYDDLGKQVDDAAADVAVDVAVDVANTVSGIEKYKKTIELSLLYGKIFF